MNLVYKPKGIAKAVKLLNKAESGKILVYYDPDMDGLMAGHMATRLFESFGLKYDYCINENREHGFRIWDRLPELRGWTIFAVDFAITADEMRRIEDAGVRIISIDHHEIDLQELYSTENGVIINNQYCFEPEEWRFLSGAGMVYEVLANIVPTFDTADMRAVVGLTLLSDIRVLETPLAKAFLDETYSNRSPFFQYLIDITSNAKDFAFGEVYIDRNYADYTLNPKFNALFRMNMGMQAIHLLLRDKPVKVNLTWIKEQQNDIISTIMENIEGTESDSFIVKHVREDVIPQGVYNFKLSNFIGVACSRVKACGKTTFLYVEDVVTKNCLRGSVRGLYDSVDYLGIFRKHGIECAGHRNAFGVIHCDLSKINLEELGAEIAAEEAVKAVEEEQKRVLTTSSFITFNRLKNQQIALHNMYVRDSKRVFLKYTGTSWVKTARGRMWEVDIEGIKVKCFDADLTPENGYIQPIMERGYITYFLKKLTA